MHREYREFGRALRLGDSHRHQLSPDLPLGEVEQNCPQIHKVQEGDIQRCYHLGRAEEEEEDPPQYAQGTKMGRREVADD